MDGYHSYWYQYDKKLNLFEVTKVLLLNVEGIPSWTLRAHILCGNFFEAVYETGMTVSATYRNLKQDKRLVDIDAFMTACAWRVEVALVDGTRRCAMMSGGQLRDSLTLTTPVRKWKERPTFPFFWVDLWDGWFEWSRSHIYYGRNIAMSHWQGSGFGLFTALGSVFSYKFSCST